MQAIDNGESQSLMHYASAGFVSYTLECHFFSHSKLVILQSVSEMMCNFKPIFDIKIVERFS